MIDDYVHDHQKLLLHDDDSQNEPTRRGPRGRRPCGPAPCVPTRGLRRGGRGWTGGLRVLLPSIRHRGKTRRSDLGRTLQKIVWPYYLYLTPKSVKYAVENVSKIENVSIVHLSPSRQEDLHKHLGATPLSSTVPQPQEMTFRNKIVGPKSFTKNHVSFIIHQICI